MKSMVERRRSWGKSKRRAGRRSAEGKREERKRSEDDDLVDSQGGLRRQRSAELDARARTSHEATGKGRKGREECWRGGRTPLGAASRRIVGQQSAQWRQCLAVVIASRRIAMQ